jgi:hypothetical protein
MSHDAVAPPRAHLRPGGCSAHAGRSRPARRGKSRRDELGRLGRPPHRCRRLCHPSFRGDERADRAARRQPVDRHRRNPARGRSLLRRRLRPSGGSGHSRPRTVVRGAAVPAVHPPAWASGEAHRGIPYRRTRGATDAAEYFIEDDAFLLPLLWAQRWIFSYTCDEWDMAPEAAGPGLQAITGRPRPRSLAATCPAGPDGSRAGVCSATPTAPTACRWSARSAQVAASCSRGAPTAPATGLRRPSRIVSPR